MPDNTTIQGWFTWKWLYDFAARHLVNFDGVIRIVEVGVWKGASISYLCQKIKEYGRESDFEVFAVDPWSMDSYGDPIVDRYLAELGDDPDALYSVYDSNLRQAGVRDMVTDVRSCSPQAAEFICNRHGPVDFVFLDGDHSTESVVADIQTWRLHAPLVAGHDAAQPSVHRALTQCYGKDFSVLPTMNCWVNQSQVFDRWVESLTKGNSDDS